jgi:hypothetical protein
VGVVDGAHTPPQPSNVSTRFFPERLAR